MIQWSRWTKSAGVLLLALAPVACEDLTGSDGSEGTLDYDVAAMAAELVLEDIAEQVSFGGPSPSLAPSDAVSGSTTHSFSRTFFDESGAEMDSYDPLLTASILIEKSWSREGTRGPWTGSFTREFERTVSGLLGTETERTWNGTGGGTIERSRFTDTNGVREYNLTFSTVVDDVVIAVDREAQPWPLSGTITREMTLTRTRGEETITRMRTVVVAFDGTQFATVTVNGVEFELDLAAEDGPPVRRR